MGLGFWGVAISNGNIENRRENINNDENLPIFIQGYVKEGGVFLVFLS
jgi:hypothetical protein